MTSSYIFWPLFAAWCGYQRRGLGGSDASLIRSLQWVWGCYVASSLIWSMQANFFTWEYVCNCWSILGQWQDYGGSKECCFWLFLPVIIYLLRITQENGFILWLSVWNKPGPVSSFTLWAGYPYCYGYLSKYFPFPERTYRITCGSNCPIRGN